MLVTNQLTVAIDFHSMKKKKYYGNQWLSSTVWLVTNILQNISGCVNDANDDRIYMFWVTTVLRYAFMKTEFIFPTNME